MSSLKTPSTFIEGPTRLGKAELAALVAADIPDGAFVNLGIGQPTLVSNYLAPDSGVTLHTENASATYPQFADARYRVERVTIFVSGGIPNPAIHTVDEVVASNVLAGVDTTWTVP